MSGANAGMIVVPPKTHEPTEINKVVRKATSRAKRRDEAVLVTWNAWMPYHRIRITCSNMDGSRTEKVTTALNAMFCASATTERELLQLFRPKHLDSPLKEMDPEPTEVVCPHPEVDLNAIVDKLVKIREQARGQISRIEGQLIRSYRRMQWQHLILPTTSSSLQREREASAKLAELQSASLAVDICLNLTRVLLPQAVEGHDIFYAPMAVVQLGQGENGLGRHVLIDLTTGKVDAALTNLCELNDEFKSSLELALR